MLSPHDSCSIEQPARPQANHPQPQNLVESRPSITHAATDSSVCSGIQKCFDWLLHERKLSRLVLRLQLTCHLHFHKMSSQQKTLIESMLLLWRRIPDSAPKVLQCWHPANLQVKQRRLNNVPTPCIQPLALSVPVIADTMKDTLASASTAQERPPTMPDAVWQEAEHPCTLTDLHCQRPLY